MVDVRLSLYVVAGFLIMYVQAQVPLFGSCPNHEPMAGFSQKKFMGKWYEAERYFTLTEFASKCIAADYEKRPDGKIYVNNEVTSSLTNIQRIISGTISLTGKAGQGKFNVRYTTFPGNYETTMNILDTDYKSFAIVWSCSSITGPLPLGHSESVWVMTRKRNPSGLDLQRAYGVLDRLKISRTYFIKTNQKDCDTLPPAQEAVDSVNTDETDESETTENDETEEIVEEEQEEKEVANQKITAVGSQSALVQVVEEIDSESYEDYGKNVPVQQKIEENITNRKKLIHESQIPVQVQTY